MVVITNGLQTVVVSNGAYREIYMPQGWYPVTEPPAQAEGLPTLKREPVEPDEPEAHLDDLETTVDDPEAEGEGEAEAEGETEGEDTHCGDEDLLLRPLSDLTVDELKRVAALKGVSIEGLKVKSEIRQVIKAALKQ